LLFCAKLKRVLTLLSFFIGRTKLKGIVSRDENV
jgi:hypothetical protein